MVNDKDFVLKKLDERIESLSRRTRRQQRLAYSFRVLVTLLAFASTVLLGLTIQNEYYVKLSRNIALVCGAAITAVSTMENFWDIQRYWIRNKLILSGLKELRDEYLFLQGVNEGIKEDEKKEIFGKYLSIVRRKSEYWEDVLENERSDQAIDQRKDDNGNIAKSP